MRQKAKSQQTVSDASDANASEIIPASAAEREARKTEMRNELHAQQSQPHMSGKKKQGGSSGNQQTGQGNKGKSGGK